MRILLVNKYYHPRIGGVETVVTNIAEEFVRRGHQVTVLCMDPEIEEEVVINGVQVVRLRRDLPFLAGLNRKAWKWMKRNASAFDVVHLHNYHMLLTFQCAYLLRTERKKYVLTMYYHGRGHTFLRNILFRSYHLLGQRVLDWSERIATGSEHELSLVKRDFRQSKEKYVIIPYGSREFPDLKMERVKGRMLYVGRLMPYKNVDKCIDLLALLRQGKVEASLHIVGKGPDAERLRAHAEAQGVAERVTFLEDVKDDKMAAEYQSASLLILLSSAESYGLVLAEALTQGTPCLVAKAAALTEFTQETGCYGVTYPLEMDELMRLAARLLDPSEKIQVGPFSDRMLSWPQVAQRYLNIYNEAVDST
ncbi:MAG: glycosyltransferase family 4 protein [Methanomassiliicoccales archaeon]